MIGQRVEFPIEWGIYEEGVVSQYNDDTGEIVVKDDNGDLWKGYEYETTTIDSKTEIVSKK